MAISIIDLIQQVMVCGGPAYLNLTDLKQLRLTCKPLKKMVDAQFTLAFIYGHDTSDEVEAVHNRRQLLHFLEKGWTNSIEELYIKTWIPDDAVKALFQTELPKLAILGIYPKDEEGERALVDYVERPPWYKIKDLRINVKTILPKWVRTLTELVSLELRSFSEMTIIPDWINTLERLENLEITGDHRVKTLPRSLESLINLKQLTIREFSKVTSLDNLLSNLRKLDHLTIYDCAALKTLFEALSELKLLKSIEIASCIQLECPSSVVFLPPLEKLCFADEYQTTTSLPDFIVHLAKLRELRLEFNRMTSLPSSFGHYPALTYLDLNFPEVQNLPMHFGLGMPNLEEFSLLAPLLQALPDSIGQLKALKSLTLDCRSLPQLPHSIGDLGITRLSLADCNELVCLPNTISKLTNLQEIHICRCKKLSQLPDLVFLQEMVSLKYVYACGCEGMFFQLPLSVRLRI